MLPFAEMPRARPTVLDGQMPRFCIPPALVQRKSELPPLPATALPVAEIEFAAVHGLPNGGGPRSVMPPESVQRNDRLKLVAVLAEPETVQPSGVSPPARDSVPVGSSPRL